MLNENGYSRPAYEVIVAAKEQTARELFGEDIKTDALTPLGKFIRITAYELSKAYEDIEKVYYSRYPNYATGVSLDRLLPFAGITRNPATYAQHLIRVYGTETAEAETPIGIGELIVCGDDADITFYSDNDYVIPSKGGYADITVVCTEAGLIGNVPSITEIVNPIAEIDHIEYLRILEEAIEAESDYDLRKRFADAIEGAGSTNVNAIRAALLRVPTVISASVIENKEDTADGKGRPPHSFECFVYGGEEYEQELAEAIFEKAPIGIKTCSTSETPVIKTVKDDGGYEHTITFSHTENVNVYIRVRYKKDTRFEDDGQTQIRNVLTKHINSLGVGADVILSTLYGKIYTVSGITDIPELIIGVSSESLSSGNIAVEEWQVAQVANIELYEVT